MSMLHDFLAMAASLLVFFGIACWLAWRSGRETTASHRRVLRVIPYVPLCLAASSGIQSLLIQPTNNAMAYVQLRTTEYAAVFFVAACLCALYARIAPKIHAAGAAHHPAPRKLMLSAQAIHLRRRHQRVVERQAVPFYILGVGIALLSFFHGVDIEHGGWVTLSITGFALWIGTVQMSVEFIAKRRARHAHQSDISDPK